MTVRHHLDLSRRLEAAGIRLELVPVDGAVERLREVKDAWEVATLREAGQRLSDAAKCIIPKALAGMKERDVAAIIEAELRRVGFDKPAFDTIVASGPNSAVPHYRAGDRVLTAGDLVVLDFGGMFRGYAVDMTRTITVGPASATAADGCWTTSRRRRTPASRRRGRASRPTDIDRAARESMDAAGLGECFGHGTGHGLGLEVHERPRIAQSAAGLPGEPLQPGMVFTIEPGAYFPDWGGARIEDDAALTASGARVADRRAAVLDVDVRANAVTMTLDEIKQLIEFIKRSRPERVRAGAGRRQGSHQERVNHHQVWRAADAGADADDGGARWPRLRACAAPAARGGRRRRSRRRAGDREVADRRHLLPLGRTRRQGVCRRSATRSARARCSASSKR